MRKKWVWAVIIVLAVAALVGVNILKMNKTVDVKWATVKQASLQEEVYANGVVESSRVTPVAFTVDGQIDGVKVKAGDRVTTGQTLVTLDVSDLQRQYDEGVNNLKLLQVQKDQKRKDAFDQAKLDKQAGKEPADPPDLRTFDLQIANAQKDLDHLKQQLEASTLTAPHDGVVTEMDLYDGEMVAKGAKAMTIVDDHALQVRANVNQLDANKVKEGMKAKVTGDAFDGEYAGEITRVSPIARLASSADQDPSVEILAKIDQPDEQLRAGYNATIGVPIPHPERVVVNQTAILRESGKTYVLEAKDGKLAKVPVTTGEENDEQIEVLRGLSAGDKIVADVSGYREGQKVKPQ